MAESPPRGGAPSAEDGTSEATVKPGESDPLFHPPGLKTRRTVMGLAPAPHLGGARGAVTEAEERKQRVLARIAAIDGKADPTGPPPPPDGEVDREPEPVERPKTAAPPADLRSTHVIERPPTHSPPKFGTSTVLMRPSPGGPRTISSDARVPSASGWEVHDPRVPYHREAPEVATEVMEAAPITARMVSALPLEVRASQEVRPSSPPDQRVSAPTPPPTAALAIRAYEPPRSSLVGLTDPRLVLFTEPHSTRASSYRLLRDSLIAKSMPRVLAVSSAVPGDGKTTCAINLALGFSEISSTRVLLVDGNFFAPELADVFAIDRLTAIVPPDGNAWLNPYKLVEVSPGLHVAGISRAPGEPPPRFDQQRFEAMIDRLVRVSYDYIIIDTPALRGSPAVIQLVGVADATLLAVRSGTTAGRDLRRAIEQIPEKKAFGLALIDAAPHE